MVEARTIVNFAIFTRSLNALFFLRFSKNQDFSGPIWDLWLEFFSYLSFKVYINLFIWFLVSQNIGIAVLCSRNKSLNELYGVRVGSGYINFDILPSRMAGRLGSGGLKWRGEEGGTQVFLSRRGRQWPYCWRHGMTCNVKVIQVIMCNVQLGWEWEEQYLEEISPQQGKIRWWPGGGCWRVNF